MWSAFHGQSLLLTEPWNADRRVRWKPNEEKVIEVCEEYIIEQRTNMNYWIYNVDCAKFSNWYRQINSNCCKGEYFAVKFVSFPWRIIGSGISGSQSTIVCILFKSVIPQMFQNTAISSKPRFRLLVFDLLFTIQKIFFFTTMIS